MLRQAPELKLAATWRRRRISSTSRTFYLGYAPGGWDGLVKFLEGQNASLEDAAAAGLISQGQRGYVDRLGWIISQFVII